LPQSTFFPATVSTNLLFFEKGEPTKEIWYYEHRLPEGQKSYSKTKPIQFNEFKPLIKWWNDRQENEIAWNVKVKDLSNWDLDIKNPNRENVEYDSSNDIYDIVKQADEKYSTLIDDLYNELLIEYQNSVFNEIVGNRKDLLKNIDFIKLLRQSILQEAIQGKLTAEWREQNPNTESASELLIRIKAEKEKLVKEKKIKKEKPLPPILENEIPFELPKGWVWCRLGDACEIIMGQSPEGDSVNISKDGMEFHQGKIFFTDEIIAKSNQTTNQIKKIAPENSVLLCVRAPVGKVNITDREICIGRGLCALKTDPFIGFKFLYYLIATLENSFISKAKGSTFTAISLDIIKNEIIALPPLSEQQAIVTKVETLLEKCSRLQMEIENLNRYSKDLLQALFSETFENKKGK